MKAVAIVQARASSTRLPGKVLMDLGGHSVLWHVLTRCASIPGIDEVCCAVPEGADHDPVAAEAEAAGADTYRGAEHDVLDRYREAARATAADVILRVTSDCPLIDPWLCGEVLEAVRHGADYAANNFTHGYPHGLDCEAFTRDSLELCWVRAEREAEREHVTPWLRTANGIDRVSLEGPGGDAASWRWTLDYPEDLDFLRSVCARLGPSASTAGWQEVADLLRREPALLGLNAARAQR